MNCLETTPGKGAHLEGIDLQDVAGLGDRVLLGFADGIGAGGAGRGGCRGHHCGVVRSDWPCRFNCVRMRLTMEVETGTCCWRSRMASLPLPQPG